MIEALLERKIANKILEVAPAAAIQAAGAGAYLPGGLLDRAHQGLLERARANLLGLRLKNLRLTHGDGHAGLEKAAPFQSIIVAAAARQIPDALLRQLAPGGRMILPLRRQSGARRSGWC